MNALEIGLAVALVVQFLATFFAVLIGMHLTNAEPKITGGEAKVAALFLTIALTVCVPLCLICGAHSRICEAIRRRAESLKDKTE